MQGLLSTVHGMPKPAFLRIPRMAGRRLRQSSSKNRRHCNVRVKIRDQKPPKPPLPLARRGRPSNTAMPRPNVCTSQTAAPMDHALSHSYGAKSPLVSMGHPIFAPEITLCRGTIPKPHHLLHPWTHPTYRAKCNLGPIRRFSTMHWTDRQTNRPTDR